MIGSPSQGGRNPLDPSTQTNLCEETDPEMHPVLMQMMVPIGNGETIFSRLALFAENPKRPGNCFMCIKCLK